MIEGGRAHAKSGPGEPGEQHPVHLWLTDIREGDRVKSCYLVKEKRTGKTRNGKPFLSLILSDRTGDLEAKVWEEAEELSGRFKRGDIVEVVADAVSYRGQVQLTITALEPSVEVLSELFLESAPEDPDEMIRSVRDILKQIGNVHLRELVDRFLSDREFMARFKQAPAAKHFHHSYLGGLLEHTLAVCRFAEQAARFYPQLDKDLLLAGAFLHDIGKIRELSWFTRIDYTDEGRLIGHLVLGAAMVDEKLSRVKGFPRELALRLKHLILSHHGHYEFGSPKRPKFLEALALNLIDDLDAKISGIGRFMDKDRREGPWTDFNRLFERYFLKGDLPLPEEDLEEETPEDPQQILFDRDSD